MQLPILEYDFNQTWPQPVPVKSNWLSPSTPSSHKHGNWMWPFIFALSHLARVALKY